MTRSRRPSRIRSQADSASRRRTALQNAFPFADFAPKRKTSSGFDRRFVIGTLGAMLGVFAAVYAMLPGLPQAQAHAGIGERHHFGICTGPMRFTCVVDGDTIWLRGEKIRLVGFDTPETYRPRCAAEKRLGEKAKYRLQELLNSGPIEVAEGDEDVDRYGRLLRIIKRDGQSVGDTLISEGLAEPYGYGKPDWCSYS